ncbi:hypothetical protein L3X38_010305 [Prunus dulcis]|uniref:R13L1/DRL21-like LRR repeat region domain-containing protein n=1 Tax=Prunus dulcis TaxID=3755 RepID=A0AAD4ZDW5_PRUDU|nr:hypothetical protein L3X38_010305 [Prunus dulcis]
MLTGCKSLTKLPVDMRKLINLHHLDVSGTKIVEMPVQMGRLKSLRTLAAFVVGKSTGPSIGELRELPQLRGKLSILKLQNVVDARDALQGNLKDKKDLKELELEWSDEDADDSLNEKDVLDKLQPCLLLVDATNWALPALKKLRIKRMKLVKTIGVEFYGRNEGSPIQPFQSLEKLQFGEMAEWEEWVPSGSGSGGEYGPDFPRLQELFLEDCPKLRGLGHLTSLQSLHISGCDSIQFLPEEGLPPSLSFLRISQCSVLEKRYQNKAGEDWAKISHIPCIRINDDVTI